MSRFSITQEEWDRIREKKIKQFAGDPVSVAWFKEHTTPPKTIYEKWASDNKGYAKTNK